MARFGLLMLNNGVWNNDTVMHDQAYLYDMTHPSQTLNNSYGYLWWLNSGPNYMIPGLQWTFNGNITPNAPTDMYAAMGKNGQLLNVVPSKNLIVVRMGDNPSNSLVPVTFQNDMWEKLNDVMCFTSLENEQEIQNVKIYPNPVNDWLYLKMQNQKDFSVQILDVSGRLIYNLRNINKIKTSQLSPGIYFLMLEQEKAFIVTKFVKE